MVDDAKTLACSIQMKVLGTHVNTRGTDIASVVITDPLVLNFTDTLTNGTGDGSADLMYHERIVETNASETIFDLSSLATAPGNFAGDAFGTDITFTTIKLIMVRWVSGGSLIIGGTTSEEWFDTDVFFYATDSQIHFPAGGVLMAYSPTTGWPVSGNTKDKFIINTSATATYDIVIIGESDA